MERENLPARHDIDDATLLAVVAGGDCSRLTAAQKIQYYRARCEAAGLDYRAQPFLFIRIQGKEVLYATKSATDQLAAKHGARVEVLSQLTESNVRTVTVRAFARDGRQTDEIGCVPLAGLQGDALCNAFMKAVTKAKRRAVLSICGLGMLDETELETIPGATPVPFEVAPGVRETHQPGVPEHPVLSEVEAIPEVLQEVEAIDEASRRERCRARMLEIAGGNIAEAKKLCQRYSPENGQLGFSSVNSPRCTGEALVALDRKIKDVWTAWKKENAK